MSDRLESIRVELAGISTPARVVIASTLTFIAVSIWWVVVDNRIPGGGDPGIHLNTMSNLADALANGDIGAIADVGPVGDAFFYPPLVHFVGALPTAFGLAAQDAGVVAINLAFVPLLTAGIYLSAKRIYGPVAGALAVVFALGAPMVLSLFHVFVLDAPLAAMVAVTFAALLASERFAKARMAILVGALAGACMLIKPAAPLYLVGPVAVTLALGGWRNWRNVALAGGVALLVTVPYYAIHLDDVLSVGRENTIGTDIGETGQVFDRSNRISYENFSWYGWAAINEQYFVPLFSLFAVGFVAAVRDLRRRPHVPELLAGVVVTYLLLALVLSIRDARYTLPLVVFVAAIATGWIATTSREWLRAAGLTVLGLAVAANVAAAMTDVPELKPKLPGTIYELDNNPGLFTILDDRGYFVGPPEPNDLWTRLFDAAEREGLDTAKLNVRTTGLWGEDPIAFDVVARQSGVREVTLIAPRPRHPDLIIDSWFDDAVFIGEKGFPPPCGRIEEGLSFEGEPLAISVLVRRHTGGGRYERWCEF